MLWPKRFPSRFVLIASGFVVICLLAGRFTATLAITSGHDDLGVVDVELVLAADVSGSMQLEELAIQRRGYAEAFRSRDVIEAIVHGGYGRVAVTYVEWAGKGAQSVIVPWTLIDSSEDAFALADRLLEDTPRNMRRTSISDAIRFSASLFQDNDYRGIRRVIDISGDGPNNHGGPVLRARNEALAAGITINGLPIMTMRSVPESVYDIDNLGKYYSKCVIGGPRAFMIPVHGWDEFPDAIRRKLVLELGRGDSLIEQAAFEGDVVMAEPVFAGEPTQCAMRTDWKDQRSRNDGT